MASDEIARIGSKTFGKGLEGGEADVALGPLDGPHVGAV